MGAGFNVKVRCADVPGQLCVFLDLNSSARCKIASQVAFDGNVTGFYVCLNTRCSSYNEVSAGLNPSAEGAVDLQAFFELETPPELNVFAEDRIDFLHVLLNPVPLPSSRKMRRKPRSLP